MDQAMKRNRMRAARLTFASLRHSSFMWLMLEILALSAALPKAKRKSLAKTTNLMIKLN